MEQRENALSSLLAAALAALSGCKADPHALALLHYLGYDGTDPGVAPTRMGMLRTGAAFHRLFQLPMPDAPGMVFFGAEADPASLGPHNAGLPSGGFAGAGLNVQRAFESCVGEGIEYLSQFAQPEDRLQCGTFAAFAQTLDQKTCNFLKAVFSNCGISDDRVLHWLSVQRLSDQQSCLYPADLCLRRRDPDFTPPLKLSTGCAAGPTLADATARAMLELIERDALALWWRGGQPPRTIAADTEAAQSAAVLLAQARRGSTGRQTHLLDITTDLGIPVVAAFSARPDGYGSAFGLACRMTLKDAACSAIFEMCQSELSLHVIAAKRLQSGEASLNESDLRQHARAMQLDTHKCLLLQPREAPATPPLPASWTTMMRHLTERGIVVYALDLTRPQFSIPVVRVIAPGLQNEPCKIDTKRLLAMVGQSGGGAKYTNGIDLL